MCMSLVFKSRPVKNLRTKNIRPEETE